MSSPKDEFARALKRARRSKSHEKATVSSVRMPEAKIAALVGAPDVDVHEKASRVVGELVDFYWQPRAFGPRKKGSVPLVPQPCGKALQDRRDTNTAIANDARASDLESTLGGLGDVYYRWGETTARSATVQHAEQNKPRIASVGAEIEVLKDFETAETTRTPDLNDSTMPAHLATAALEDHRWLSCKASFDLDHDNSRPINNRTKNEKELEQISAPLFKDGDDRYDQLITLDLVVDMDGQAGEESPNADLPPEMDTGYDTSESGRSVAEELAEEYLKPIHSMYELLPTEINGRFGSYYSPTSETNPGLQTWPEIFDAAYDANKRQSRFSWTSSIYSDDGLDEKSIWWKPIEPLIVRKEPEQPPPVPTRNPMRLLRRLSKSEPKGFSEERRGSRNTHNLYLDLSRSNTRDQKSTKSSTLVRGISRTHSARKENKKSTSSRPQLSLVIPGHISNAMCTSIQDGTKVRPSTKTSTSSRKYGSTHSASKAARKCVTSTKTTSQSRNISTRNVASRSVDSASTASTTQSRSKSTSTKATPPQWMIDASATSKAHGRSHSARETPVETPRRTPPLSSGYVESLRSARGHARGSSEPLRSGVSNVSSKWSASMPSHQTVRKSCITSLVNEGTMKRGASHTAAAHKQLPPLPVDMKL